MLGAVFSFRGRLNRIQYFLSLIGLGFATMVVAVVTVLGAFGGQMPVQANLMHAGVIVLLVMLVAVPAYFWVSFSLQARRFRDIGWDPILMIPGWLMLEILDRLAVHFAPEMAVVQGIGVSWFGLLLNLGLGLCLLFWPGRAVDDIASVFDDVPPPRMAAGPAPSEPAVRPPTQWPSTPVAGGFGRRGV